MNRYSATVHREGDWWVIDVEGVAVTQAKRLDKVEHMARDLVAAYLDVDYDDVAVDVMFDLKPELDSLLSRARSATEAAKSAQKAATDLSRAAVARLQAEHLSLRDIAKLTGVSFQRVHQLAADIVDAAKSAGTVTPPSPEVQTHASKTAATKSVRSSRGSKSVKSARGSSNSRKRAGV